MPVKLAGLDQAVPVTLAGVERSALAKRRGVVPVRLAGLTCPPATPKSSHRLAGVERSALANGTGTASHSHRQTTVDVILHAGAHAHPDLTPAIRSCHSLLLILTGPCLLPLRTFHLSCTCLAL